ncbi:hypothetical protein [Pseudooceanicola sp.]|uniref:hypothetical protein n=1 Tax=Pseudooceanicola sp. TaxID=1914328 RepID=UPI0035C7872E
MPTPQQQTSTPAETTARTKLPVRGETVQDRGRNVYFSKGQDLARQDRWDMLAKLIAETDRKRASSLSGVSMAALLADGARSDAVRHARGAVSQGDTEVPGGILALQEIAEEHENAWGVALVVARAQIECAWAYEGQVDPYALPSDPSDGFLERFEEAATLIERATAQAPESAEIAATRCDLLAADPRAMDRVDDLHIASVTTDRDNPGRIRAYGVHLLPRWFGTHERLEETAQKVARDMRHIWADGGYTWMWFDALRLDPLAGEVIDTQRFIAGMHAILTSRPDPVLANLFAAYADGMDPEAAPDDLPAAALETRARIHAALPDLTERHLTELHPQVWARADALPGASHLGPLSSGRIAAATRRAQGAVGMALALTTLPGAVSAAAQL